MSVSKFHDGSRQSLLRISCVRYGNNDPQKEVKLTAYCQVLNYLLATHATEEVIGEAEDEIGNYTKPEHMSAVRYSAVLWEKFYVVVMYMKEYVLKKFLLTNCMRQSDSRWEPIGKHIKHDTEKFSKIRDVFNKASISEG